MDIDREEAQNTAPDSEGSGDDLRPGNAALDSSEEESEDSEAERKVQEGFIVQDDAVERRKKKKRKHKKREAADADEQLDEDDLELIGQGPSADSKFKRLRRLGSPDSADLDREETGDATNLAIFDDDEMAPTGYGDDDMDDFIELDPEERALQEAHLAAARQNKQGRGSSNLQNSLRGIARDQLEDISEIFGTGDEYAYAMELDDEDPSKDQPKLKDVFEPSVLKDRLMTQDDDLIRSFDVPERMQLLATRLLGKRNMYGITRSLFDKSELREAAEWIAPRIDPKLTARYWGNDEHGNPRSQFRDAFLDAIIVVLDEMHMKFREVPFIWRHRRDHLVPPGDASITLLERPHLWRIQSLTYEYRSILDRKAALARLWDRLDRPDDPYYNDLAERVESLEDAADLSDWIHVKYSKELRLRKQAEEDQQTIEGNSAGIRKRAIRTTPYERAKEAPFAHEVDNIAIDSRTLVQAFLSESAREYKEDPDELPLELANRYAIAGTAFSSAELVLAAFKTSLVEEIRTDPYLKAHVRKLMHEQGVISVRPTEKGRTQVDEHHPFHPFKYISNRPIRESFDFPRFLAMLAAEAEGLITIEITLPLAIERDLRDKLQKVYLSDYTSQIAMAWNGVRQDVLQTALHAHIIPSVAGWLRTRLKESAEDTVIKKCCSTLEAQIDMAPYRPYGKPDSTPAVVAVSFGNGNPRSDRVIAVAMDSKGRFREQIKLDTIAKVPHFMKDPDQIAAREALQKTFIDFVRQHKPDVVVVGGFTYATKSLFHDVAGLIKQVDPALNAIFVHDTVPRIYQHSKRAAEEFPQLPTLARYCIGLARLTQNAVNEYAALGDQITNITFDPLQRYVNEDRLRTGLHQIVVDVVCELGVDINRAMRDPYYAQLLPFVAGLGPRKAQWLMQEIRKIGGTLICRVDLYQEEKIDENGNVVQPGKGFIPTNMFMSCAAFLKIDQAFVEGAARDPDSGTPDILDSTRIHPEDYEIARKMASDAEELDEEDVAAMALSEPVRQLMEGDTSKLNDLRLDDFADELQNHNVAKRVTLYIIRSELQQPYLDSRKPFKFLSDAEAFSSITGETPETFCEGLIVPVVVIATSNFWIKVRLESGIEALIDKEHQTDEALQQQQPTFVAGQTLRALLYEAKSATLMRDVEDEKDWQSGLIRLDCRQSALETGDKLAREAVARQRDRYYDVDQENMDNASLEAAKKKAAGRQRRLIQHPNFHNFNAGQAEQYLSGMSLGDCVIRPSSSGTDHLACTWKVYEGIYAHLQITELNKPKGNPLALGGKLQIGGKQYNDLDELIYSHVRSMANKVQEMMAHEKFKGTDEELVTFLRNYQMANPNMPTYGFSIDKKRPGQFNLMFITKTGQPKTWPVKVAPRAFQLFDAELPDVRSLCNAFKLQYNQLLISNGGVTASSQTPYGRTPAYAGGSTPGGRTPGSRTPGQYGFR